VNIFFGNTNEILNDIECFGSMQLDALGMMSKVHVITGAIKEIFIPFRSNLSNIKLGNNNPEDIFRQLIKL